MSTGGRGLLIDIPSHFRFDTVVNEISACTQSLASYTPVLLVVSYITHHARNGVRWDFITHHFLNSNFSGNARSLVRSLAGKERSEAVGLIRTDRTETENSR
jgi:hypothetical protein